MNMLLFKTYLFITRGKIYIYKKNRNNKLKIIASALNDEFQLPDGSYSVSDIQYYIEYIITKHEALTAICPFYVYINAINKVKVKDKSKSLK